MVKTDTLLWLELNWIFYSIESIIIWPLVLFLACLFEHRHRISGLSWIRSRQRYNRWIVVRKSRAGSCWWLHSFLMNQSRVGRDQIGKQSKCRPVVWSLLKKLNTVTQLWHHIGPSSVLFRVFYIICNSLVWVNDIQRVRRSSILGEITPRKGLVTEIANLDEL